MSGQPHPSGELGERDLHRALALGAVPVLGLPLQWSLVWRRLASRSQPAPPPLRAARRRWDRLIVGLTVLDTLIALALVIAFAMTPDLALEPAAGAGEPPRIGVELDPDWQGEGVRIAGVGPESPAQRGGMRAGDVVLAVDGEPVSDWEALAERIQQGQSGVPRHLRVLRSGEQVELLVVPEAGASEGADRALFEPHSDAGCKTLSGERYLQDSWPVAVGALLVLLLWWRARRRANGERQRWIWLLVPLVVAPLVGVGAAQVACSLAGGWSTGVVLMGLIAQGVTMLAIGLLLMAWLRRELQVVVGPRLSTARASGLAVFYVSSALVRAVVALVALMVFAPALRAAEDPGIGALFESSATVEGRVLMVLAAVIVAPAAEEVVFRGILLPGLARQMRPAAALLISSALFALFHVPSHGVGALMPGLLGVVFGWARLRTGSLAAPILLHAANNLLVTVLSWGAGSP